MTKLSKLSKLLFFLFQVTLSTLNAQSNTIIHDKICIDNLGNVLNVNQKDIQILTLDKSTLYDIPIGSAIISKSIIFDTIIYPEYHAKYITGSVKEDTTLGGLLISGIWGQPNTLDYKILPLKLLDRKPSGYMFDGNIEFTHENLLALKEFADKLVLEESGKKIFKDTTKESRKNNVTGKINSKLNSKLKEVQPNMYSTTHISSYYFKDKDIWTSNVNDIMYGAYDLALEYTLDDDYVLIQANPLYADKVFPMLEMALSDYETISINNLIKIESANKSRLSAMDINNIKNVISDNLKE